jgi:hypothetical protein
VGEGTSRFWAEQVPEQSRPHWDHTWTAFGSVYGSDEPVWLSQTRMALVSESFFAK